MFLLPRLILASAALAAGAQPLRLERGQPVTKAIQTGEVHKYQISGRTGEMIRGSVRQDGITLRVRGFFPDGSKIRSFSGPAKGVRNFRFVVEAPGDYQLELTAVSAAPASGSYTISLDRIERVPERLNIASPEGFESPRIKALRREIQTGGRQASLDKFWALVQAEGTPMAEPVERDASHWLVTFLWRQTFELHNVLVLWEPYASEHPDDFRMHRLGDTDVWYKTLRFPKGSRFFYQLSPNDTLTRSPNAQRYATAQADPLNPRRYPADPNITRYEVQSMAELPDASPQPWSARRPEVPRGELRQHRYRSEILGNERAVTVYTPPGYRTDGNAYPFLLLFDGATYQTDVPAPVILDNLIAVRKIPPMAAVLVDNASPDLRGAELFGNPRFAGFIATELVPWAAKEYRLSGDRSRNVIGGLSAGGFAAAFVALRHPGLFGNVISQSGAFWWSPKVEQGEERGWLTREYIAAPSSGLRFYLEAGLFENDIRGAGGQILEHNRHLRDVLRAKGYQVFYHEYPGGHDRLTWRGSLADALIELLGHE
jgi:enterochelin esterase-like enzyme